MAGRAGRSSAQRRQLLTDGWQMCAAAPDAIADPADLSRHALTWIPLRVPGTAASGLRAAGHWSVGDSARRFDAEDWWFRVRFESPSVGADEELILGLDGLATVAQVWLDDRLLLSSENMFVAHERALDANPSEHELVICCRALDSRLGVRRPRPRWRAPMIENQQLRWFRTTLLGRTPGWSPAAAAVGPWRDVWLEQRSVVAITNLRLRSQLHENHGQVEVGVDLHPIAGARIDSCELIISRDSREYRALLEPDGTREGYRSCVAVEDPVLWWPHTHGDPALYQARLEIRHDGKCETAALGSIAFRSVSLDTTAGKFSLLINGVKVFCRGACWTPLDPVALQSSAADYAAALEQVVGAGMNMLRVSGTMVYESDAFLDECDRRGILLWHEFMFANMDYPADDPAFAASVAVEVAQQLARLQARPALVVLCGNSEVAQQAAMWGADRELWRPALFHEHVAQQCRLYCPDVAYLPSSTDGGAFPHQPNVGVTSYYGVGAYLRGLDDARRSELKFASECLAFANIPEDATIATMPGGRSVRVHHPAWKSATPRDLGAGWDFEDVRDHYLQLLFQVDPPALRHSDHDRYLQLSRIVTGEVMAAAYAEWRRERSSCSGALVWFLRDLVPGAGWGIIDANGTPKAAYYYLKRALQPIACFFSDEGCNGLFAHVANETPRAIHSRLEITLYKADAIVGTACRSLGLAPRSMQEENAAAWFDGCPDLSNAYRFGPPIADVILGQLRSEQGEILSEAFAFPAGLPRSIENNIGLSARARRLDGGVYEVSIKADRFAQSLHIDAAGFVAQDQYFHLAPHSERMIRLVGTDSRSDRPLHGTVRAANARQDARIVLE
jgi:beta-mannosidase